MEPDLASTAHMKFVDKRCACCPYGYHIDIDFLRYLESLGRSADDVDSVDVHMHDGRQTLRRSMELFLRQQQELEAAASASAAAAAGTARGTGDSVDVDLQRPVYDQSSYVQSLAGRQDRVSSRILENVDSSLYEASSSRPKYRTEAALSVSRDPDSSSSVSIHSGPSSPAAYQHVDVMPTGGSRAVGASWTQNGQHVGGGVSMTSQQQVTSQSLMTSSGGGVTDEMETLLVDGVVNPGLPGIPADMTLISSATLQTIREQMAASLRRMKQLEDENDALRLLEVRTTLHTLVNVHCVSKNVPPLQLAVIFTYTVRL